MAALVAFTAGCTHAEIVGGGPPGTHGTHVQLVSALVPFDACDDLLTYLKDGARQLGLDQQYKAYAMADAAAEGSARASSSSPAPSAAPEAKAAADSTAASGGTAATDFSTTNVQEAGADEPDVVKTDGRRLFTMSGSTLKVVDVSGSEPQVVGSLDLGQYAYGTQLLLAGDRLLALHGAAAPGASDGASGGVGVPVPSGPAVNTGVAARGVAGRMVVDGIYPMASGGTGITVVDVSDAAHPTIVSDLSLDGGLVSARLVDGVAKVVVRTGAPGALWRAAPGGQPTSIDATTLDDWLPRYSYLDRQRGTTTSGRLTDCRSVTHPVDFSGVDTVTVVAVDPADPRPGPGASVVGAGELVYATTQHLYVTSTSYSPPPTPTPPMPATEPTAGSGAASGAASRPFAAGGTVVQGPATKTQVHEFDIADKVRTAYLASGEVDGHALNQFSMSEYNDDLRIATTRDDTADSQIAVLRRNGDRLDQIGAVGGLGQGEHIYSVRFLGALGYVVTFRQTDPLFVVDLSDPASPVVKGELEIPGYSAYLHPIGDGLLLGLGQDVPEQGRAIRLGTQLSVFDVTDPANPGRLSQIALGPSQSPAEYDHHAFLWWPKENLAVIPVMSLAVPSVGGPGQVQAPRQQIVGFTVTRDGIAERGRIDAGALSADRTLVIGDRLLAVGEGGVVTADLGSFAETSRLTF